MTSVAEALRQHAPEYLRGLAETPANVAVRKTLSAILRCRTGALGGVQWQCTGCGRRHWAGRSCGNRHCSTCGADKTQAWLTKQSGKLLPGVHYFLITFTVPQELRDVLRAHQRAGYEALFAASSAALRDVAAATRSLCGCQLGFFGVLHTWGRDPLVYHPHVHFVVPGGGVAVDDAGRATGWRPTATNFFVHHATLIRVYKAKLADELRARGLYDLVPKAAWRKKFVVDLAAVDDGRAVVAYLAPYVHRVAIGERRVTRVDATSVTYRYRPSQTPTWKTRTVPGGTFVAGFAQHILPSRFQKVRHYGWLSNHSKIPLEEVRMLSWFALGWTYWLASGQSPRQPPAKMPTLRCLHCGSAMRVIRIVHGPLHNLLSNHALAYLDSG